MGLILDTGLCISESRATLSLQQAQLVAGRRDVQMFPSGTRELPLPEGMQRFENDRGVFHFRADKISAVAIGDLSSQGRENEFLNLGPYSKPEIAERALAGESLMTVTEYTPSGVEVRSAAGTAPTIEEQRKYFERTKEPGNAIVVADLPSVLSRRLAA